MVERRARNLGAVQLAPRLGSVRISPGVGPVVTVSAQMANAENTVKT